MGVGGSNRKLAAVTSVDSESDDFVMLRGFQGYGLYEDTQRKAECARQAVLALEKRMGWTQSLGHNINGETDGEVQPYCHECCRLVEATVCRLER